jgi:hypothetical protein
MQILNLAGDEVLAELVLEAAGEAGDGEFTAAEDPRVVGRADAISKYGFLMRVVGSGELGEFFAQGFHLGQGMLVVGAVGGGYSFVQAGEGLFSAA